MKISVLLFCVSIAQFIHAQKSDYSVLVLGIAQDGGFPHIGCQAECCANGWSSNSKRQNVVSLALIDAGQKKWWLFEATPNITEQLHLFQQLTQSEFNFLPEGIFLSHAHIGHYTGLMQLGREALGAKSVAVFALPKMANYLSNNGPWSQLILLKNIELKPLNEDQAIQLSDEISVTAFTVPHRDEFSETAGFRIITSAKRYLFIPDIDKWDKWNRNIVDEVSNVDVALLDATFYSSSELPGRDIKEIPHPLVSETMQLFSGSKQKEKIFFIHFNHTNPLLWNKRKRTEFLKTGFRIAKQGMRL